MTALTAFDVDEQEQTQENLKERRKTLIPKNKPSIYSL